MWNNVISIVGDVIGNDVITQHFKAYGLVKDKYVFILLFTPSTATFALRSVMWPRPVTWFNYRLSIYRKLTEENFELIIQSHLTAFNSIK